MKYLTAVLVAAFLVCQAKSDSSDSDKADAAMALAKAKAARPRVKSQTQFVSYADAKKLSKSDGRPILISIGMDCKHLCDKLRPDIITCHEKEFGGSSAKRVRLEIPAATPSGWIVLEWAARCPLLDEVKEELIKHSPRTSLSEEWDKAISGAVLALTALESDDPPVVMNGKRLVCVNGVCQWVDVDAKQMPVGSGPNTAYPPAVGSGASGGRFFKARFPRIASFRGRVRSFAGLPPPQVRGQFYQLLEQEVQPEAQASPDQGAQAVQVSGAARGHRLIKLYLLRNGVPAAELEKFEKKYGDSTAWVDLLLTFLRGGLELLLEALEKMLNK